MKHLLVRGILIFLISGSFLSVAEGSIKKDFKGRIAWSADGNWNDEDDWAASPVALAIFAGFDAQEKLVHFDYNNILTNTDKAWEKEHEISVLGAAERFGFSKSVFHDCQKDLDAAVISIANAINASSEDNPLYFVLAGPMEVPYLGIQKSDPEKRKYVYCISHNRWNDGYGSTSIKTKNKRDVIPQGVTWIQITDQNQFLTTSPFGRAAEEEEWEPWHWMKYSKDPNVRFLWDRMRVENRADCSDAGMAYFLMTGDELTEINKLKSLLEDKTPQEIPETRRVIRMEAENFTELNNFQIDDSSDRDISQRLCVSYGNETSGSITTSFKEIFVPAESMYDIDIRYFSGTDPETQYTLYVDNERACTSWKSTEQDTWQTRSIKGVRLKKGDQLMLEVDGKKQSGVKLDYIELTDWIQKNPFTARITGKLDNPDALPGQIIVAGTNPGYLKYNGGGTAFLAGPDNPEHFLFMGDLNPDGTRSGGGQEEVIKRLRDAGVNAFHFQMFRMKKYNIKGEWNDQHAPFNDFDPSKGLNQAMLDQWDHWLDLFEENGIVVHFEFYNDATDVEMLDLWKLEEEGNLHPDEYAFITGVVEKFRHHKNIIWALKKVATKFPAAV